MAVAADATVKRLDRQRQISRESDVTFLR